MVVGGTERGSIRCPSFYLGPSGSGLVAVSVGRQVGGFSITPKNLGPDSVCTLYEGRVGVDWNHPPSYEGKPGRVSSEKSIEYLFNLKSQEVLDSRQSSGVVDGVVCPRRGRSADRLDLGLGRTLNGPGWTLVLDRNRGSATVGPLVRRVWEKDRYSPLCLCKQGHKGGDHLPKGDGETVRAVDVKVVISEET